MNRMINIPIRRPPGESTGRRWFLGIRKRTLTKTPTMLSTKPQHYCLKNCEK
jgi:hypothetical protein